MHEAGIIASALETVRREAAARQATRVHRVVLRIGSLAGVDPEALRFAYDSLAPGTIAADAVLDIETVVARAHCAACNADFAIESGFIFTCPQCRALSAQVCAGRELELARLEFSSATP